MAEIFRSENLKVIEREGAGKVAFVTFLWATKNFGLGNEGFGERFLARAGIPAYHFVPSRNLWYQTSDMIEAGIEVRERVKGYERVITYGSSMGGYAALNFAALVGATDIIAISPQFSIDPGKIPEENRYLSAHEQVTPYVYDRVAALPGRIRTHVIYDPFNPLDARQAEEVARLGGQLTPLKYATHPVTSVLSAESLKRLVLASVEGPVSGATAELRQAYRRDRGKSAHYFLQLARQRRASTGRRMGMVERALAIDPERADAYLLLANLVMKEDAPRAISLCRRALVANPGFYPARVRLVQILKAQGMADEARQEVQFLLDSGPGVAQRPEVQKLAAGFGLKPAEA